MHTDRFYILQQLFGKRDRISVPVYYFRPFREPGNMYPTTRYKKVSFEEVYGPKSQRDNSGILGKARYMAPEVVTSKTLPNKQTDRFSLSVVLFMLFYGNHPFEGAKVVACPCMTEKFEKEFYGSKALFIYNPDDKSNLPVRGVHQNVIKRWPLFPTLLKQTFIDQFSE